MQMCRRESGFVNREVFAVKLRDVHLGRREIVAWRKQRKITPKIPVNLYLAELKRCCEAPAYDEILSS
jgi:hypothetical protein